MLRKSLPALFLVLTWWFCVGVGSLTGLPPTPNEHAAPSDLMTFAASPNGKWIAAFAADGTLLLWDTETWHRREPISNYKFSLGADGLAFSPDSSRLAVGDGNGLIHIFDPYSGTVLRRMQDKDWVEQFAFSGDGTHLATWNHKGITVWNIGSDELTSIMIERYSGESGFLRGESGFLREESWFLGPLVSRHYRF